MVKVTTSSEALRCNGAAKGGLVTMRVATSVNAEQAPKRAMRKPTRHENGEGCHLSGSE